MIKRLMRKDSLGTGDDSGELFKSAMREVELIQRDLQAILASVSSISMKVANLSMSVAKLALK